MTASVMGVRPASATTGPAPWFDPRESDHRSGARPVPRRSALVITVVHHPLDSRIRYRQIEALLAAGWDVTYAAPFAARGLEGLDVPGSRGRGTLSVIDVARSRGRRRFRGWKDAREVLKQHASGHDRVLVHDPELLIAAAGLGLRNLIWDVHEDASAAIHVKSWMPTPLRTPVARAWRIVERLVERRHTLFLAEYSYQQRFRRRHAVVPNAVSVPAIADVPTRDQVSYLGSVTMSRGCDAMIAVARELSRRTEGAVTVQVIGEAGDAESRTLLTKAHESGDLTWWGYLPSDEAFTKVAGSLAGLCLLRDLPNFQLSMPTKIAEYAALGVPAVTTPLPLATELVKSNDLGLVVGWDDVNAVVDAVLLLRADPVLRDRLVANGRRVARRDHDWHVHGDRFVHLMEQACTHRSSPAAAHRGTIAAA